MAVQHHRARRDTAQPAMTEQQLKLLAFLVSYENETGECPTLADCARALGWRQNAGHGVEQMLERLERRGYLRMRWGEDGNLDSWRPTLSGHELVQPTAL